MDSEEIDRKIETVGTEIFDNTTRNWLTNILTKYHAKVSPISANASAVLVPAASTRLSPTPARIVEVTSVPDDDADQLSPPSPGSPTSTSRPSSPDSESAGHGSKPRSRKSTSAENGGKRMKDSPHGPESEPQSHSDDHDQLLTPQNSVLKTELIVYTMGNLVSNDSLIIPRQSTVLGFKATYELSLASDEKLDLTKSVIVKLIDDDDAWDDYNEEDKENKLQNNNLDQDALSPSDVYNANICEYNFYMKVVPEIEAWAASRGVPFKFGIPCCIHGQYIPGTHSRKSPFLLDSLSTLVLEDLIENEGYTMKNPGLEGLALEELKLAIAEIAKIHAVTWAYQECMGVSLQDKYKNFFEDLHEQSVDFGEDIEESIPEIEAFFKERGSDDAMRLLTKITNGLLPRIQQAVQDCLMPPPTSADAGVQPLICLVHSNFWHQNLMFKDTGTRKGKTGKTKADSGVGGESDHDGASDREEEPSSGPELEPQVESEDSTGKKEPCCRILDWDNLNVSQPMIDVACLLFRSASPKVRREHLDEFMELYATTFQNTARFLQTPTIYDLDYFKQQYRKCAIFPIFLVMGTMALTLCDETAMELFMQGLLDCEADHLP